MIRTYADQAMTGTNDKREQFLQMISDSKDGSFDVVIVHKLDRFSRDRYDSAFYKRELRKNHVRICSVLENLDDSPESIILESVITGMAEYYSKNLAREVMKGMKETAYQCRHTGGLPPFGYKVNPETRRYEIEGSEADGVQYIFKSVTEGKGYDRIIRELNAMGYKTRKGLPFGKNSIHEILRNEKYAGVYIFNRAAEMNICGMRNNHQKKTGNEIIRIENGMPAIIDRKTFDTVAAIISSRKHSDESGQAKETYLLTGKIICGECGKAFGGARKFSGRSKRLYVTYRCYNRDKTGDTACGNQEIQRDMLEKFVLKQVSDMIFDDKNAAEWLKRYKEYVKRNGTERNSGIAEMKRESERLEKQIESLVHNLSDGMISKAITEKICELENKKEEVDREIDTSEKLLKVPDVTEDDMRYHYTKARELLESGQLPEIRQVINLYVEKVIIFRDHVDVYLHMLPMFCMQNHVTYESGKTDEITPAMKLEVMERKSGNGH